jgi:antitoxin MazE
MKVETEIKRWGNSLALRVSGLMAEIPGFTEGMKVAVTVTEDGLVVKPVPLEVREGALPYSERQLLRGLDADSAHADELAEPSSSELGD